MRYHGKNNEIIRHGKIGRRFFTFDKLPRTKQFCQLSGQFYNIKAKHNWTTNIFWSKFFVCCFDFLLTCSVFSSTSIMKVGVRPKFRAENFPRTKQHWFKQNLAVRVLLQHDTNPSVKPPRINNLHKETDAIHVQPPFLGDHLPKKPKYLEFVPFRAWEQGCSKSSRKPWKTLDNNDLNQDGVQRF